MTLKDPPHFFYLAGVIREKYQTNPAYSKWPNALVEPAQQHKDASIDKKIHNDNDRGDDDDKNNDEGIRVDDTNQVRYSVALDDG